MITYGEGGRAPRQAITIFVADAAEMRPLGRTRNLSRSGMLLETDEPLALGVTRELAFVWGEDTYACQARVVRHAEGAAGLAFVDVDPSFGAVLGQILDGEG